MKHIFILIALVISGIGHAEDSWKQLGFAPCINKIFWNNSQDYRHKELR
jgi:hypothetical protein